MVELNVIDRSVSELASYDRNSKIHDEKQIEQIANSIKEFGFNVPVLIDENNQIIAGHGRVMACKELGIEQVPTISLEHLTEAQKRAFVIADNKLTENAKWDSEMLKLEFQELEKLNLDFDLEITGFNSGEIDFLIQDDLDFTIEADDSYNFDLNKPAISKLGDVWQLGDHKIICGDSTKPETYQKLLGSEKANMVIADPPYNVKIGISNQGHRPFAMAHGEMSEGEYAEFLASVMKNLVEHSYDGSIHYLFINWRNMYAMQTAGRENYTELKNMCIWNKPNAGMGTFYRSKYGLVFVFKNGRAEHINNFELGQNGRVRTNVWDYPAATSFFKDPITDENRNDLMQMHPTVLPVSIFIDMMLDCSKKNSLVLDPFNGSGTSIIAAEKTGRRCFGIEYEPLYVDAAIGRWEKFTGNKAIKLSS